MEIFEFARCCVLYLSEMTQRLEFRRVFLCATRGARCEIGIQALNFGANKQSVYWCSHCTPLRVLTTTTAHNKNKDSRISPHPFCLVNRTSVSIPCFLRTSPSPHRCLPLPPSTPTIPLSSRPFLATDQEQGPNSMSPSSRTRRRAP